MFEIFKAYQFNSKKAKEYGFVENQGVWNHSSTILHGDFLMRVIVVTETYLFKFLTRKLVIFILKFTWKV